MIASTLTAMPVSLRSLIAPVLAVCLATAAHHAAAGVISVSGDVGGPWSGRPGNNSLEWNKTQHNSGTQVFIERTNTQLTTSIRYNAHKIFRYRQIGDLVNHTLPGNLYTVNSYIMHFDPTSGIQTSRGSLEFSNEIYVISKNDDLDHSDAQLGMTGVAYPGGFVPDRGYDLGGFDEFTISKPSANVWRLDFEARASTGMDQLRIVEVVGRTVPEPSSLATLLLAFGSVGVAATRGRLR